VHRFFLQNLRRFNKQFTGLFEIRDEGEDTGEPVEQTDGGFDQRYGWIYNTKRIADFEGVTMDEAYDLCVMQALNDLAYLKEKDRNDKRLINATEE